MAARPGCERTRGGLSFDYAGWSRPGQSKITQHSCAGGLHGGATLFFHRFQLKPWETVRSDVVGHENMELRVCELVGSANAVAYGRYIEVDDWAKTDIPGNENRSPRRRLHECGIEKPDHLLTLSPQEYGGRMDEIA